MNKQKILKWVVCGILSSLFVASVFLLCFLNIKDESPDKVIIKEENGVISLSTKEKTKGYGFTFKFNDGKQDILVESADSILVYNDKIIEKGIKVGKTYNVSVAINDELDVARSFYSKEVKWLAKSYLSTPEIEVKSQYSGSVETQYLNWNKIEYADYYEIYYTHNGEILKVVTDETSYKLGLLQGGSSEIWVIAKSNTGYFLDSLCSNKLSTTIYHEISDIYAVEFKKETKVLSFKIDEKIDSFLLYLDSNEPYTIVNFVYSEKENKISCNIDYIYSNQNSIGVKPKSLDGFSKHYGEIVYTTVSAE